MKVLDSPAAVSSIIHCRQQPYMPLGRHCPGRRRQWEQVRRPAVALHFYLCFRGKSGKINEARGFDLLPFVFPPYSQKVRTSKLCQVYFVWCPGEASSTGHFFVLSQKGVPAQTRKATALI